MRLPRALNPNENPAQFGIFFSANRLSTLTMDDVIHLDTINAGFGASLKICH